MKQLWMAAFVVGVCVAVSAAQEPNKDWPQFRGPTRDGHVSWLPEALPAGMKPVWSTKMSGQCDAGISVGEGVVVVPDHSEGEEGKDFYRAYDAATGKELWSREFENGREMEYGAGPRAQPLIHDGKVVVMSAFGEVYCFDLKTGKTLWEKNYEKDFKAGEPPTWGHCSAPVLAGGKVILSPGAKNASVVAVEPDTGKVVWQTGSNGPNYSSFIVAKLGGVEQIVGLDDRSLGGWDAATGKRLWTVKLNTDSGYLVPAPVVVGEKLFWAEATNDAILFEFGKDGQINPKPVATNEELIPEVVTPTAAGEMILGSHEALICLDGKSLETLWTSDEERAFSGACHIIVSGTRALAFGDTGEAVLFSFDKQGLKVLGKAKLCKATLMHPAIAGGKIYVRDAGQMHCYDLKGK